MSPENGSKSDTEADFDPENDSIISFEQFEHFETDMKLDQVFFFKSRKQPYNHQSMSIYLPVSQKNQFS